jgi:cysteine desulfuration protein SufE
MVMNSPAATTAATNPIVAEMQEIEQEFAALSDWPSKLAHLVELGRSLPGLPSRALTDASRIHGCQSQLWLLAERQGNILHLEADSDAALMRGILALLLRLYGDRVPADIMDHLAHQTACFEILGTLAPSRVKGVQLLVRRIEVAALGERP